VQSSEKLFRGLALAAVVCAYVFLTLRLIAPYTPIDDAFISFRYARHLASGHGLVFNLNEPGVEGYSSLAWVLLLAAGARLGLALPALSQGLGLLFGIGTLLVVARRRLLAAAGLALSLSWLYHTLNGLETCLMTFLVTVLTCLRLDTPRGRVIGIAVAGLLAVTRPEGLLFVLGWVAAVHLADRRLPRFRSFEVRLALTALAVFAAQTLGRLAWYGEWIANSARAKTLPLGVAIGPGLLDLGFFLVVGSACGLLPVLAAVGAVRAARSGPEGKETLARALFLALLAPALALSGGDSFALWRFYVPLIPALFVAAADGLESLLAARPWPAQRVALARALAAALLGAALTFPWSQALPDIQRESFWVHHWEDIGLRLARVLPPGTTLAFGPVGALPYRSELRTIDILGLNEPHIARVEPDLTTYVPGHMRHDGPYVLSLRPDLILLANAPVADDPAATFPWESVRHYEKDLVADPRFAAEYAFVRIPLGDRKWLLAFVRRRAT
jgi:hypothetical protein